MATPAVRIVGLNKVVRSLQKFGVEVSDLKAVFRKVGQSVADDAKSNVNSRTGSLAASIRASNAKNKAIVRAGSAKVPYAGVQEYGGYNGITPMEYLRKSVDTNEDRSVRLLEEGLSGLIRKYDLN